jgi:type IV secretory pathway VirB3-like protein
MAVHVAEAVAVAVAMHLAEAVAVVVHVAKTVAVHEDDVMAMRARRR